MRHVVFQYQASPALTSRLRQLSASGIEVRVAAPGDEAALAAALPEAQVIWHVLEPVTAGLIARAPKLGLIQKIGVGVNMIDLEAARARGIAVCNMPGTNSRAVAELTLALMLTCLRRIPMLDAELRPAVAGSGR